MGALDELATADELGGALDELSALDELATLDELGALDELSALDGAAELDELEVADELDDAAGGGVLLPHALSIRLAARAMGNPAISLICMLGESSSVELSFTEPSARPLPGIVTPRTSLLP